MLIKKKRGRRIQRHSYNTTKGTACVSWCAGAGVLELARVKEKGIEDQGHEQ